MRARPNMGLSIGLVKQPYRPSFLLPQSQKYEFGYHIILKLMGGLDKLRLAYPHVAF